jgi:glutamyl-tRNA synthetase
MSNNNASKVVCRFAPSPTGLLHVGGVRSALFNYLFANQHSGKLILRIEDTDKERSKKEYAQDIVSGFKWLGIKFDETHYQSQRVSNHKTAIKSLIDNGFAYISKEEGEGRSEVIRFRNPRKIVSFKDLIKGDISFDTTELGDFVIAKSIEEPLFHLAVVVDDFEMGVTHVIRGEDHISNTPRQILIQEALGAPRPTYAHIPLILAPDKSKLSKRKHGEMVSLTNYINKGYLAESLINYLALLGWNPGDNREMFTLAELTKEFSIDRVQKSNAVFDIQKLNFINKQYLLKRPRDENVALLTDRVRKLQGYTWIDPEMPQRIASIMLERINYFGEIDEYSKNGELAYYASRPIIDHLKLNWKEVKDSKETKENLTSCLYALENHSSNDVESLKNEILLIAEKRGKGAVLWPLRYALSGAVKSPDPFSLIYVLGKAESIERIKAALNSIL